MAHDSFENWVESEVLPLKKAHPGWLRLDGETSGSSVKEFGRFKYQGRIWKVHCDTRIEPVLAAYKAIVSNVHLDPFQVVPTKDHVRECLELVSSVRPAGRGKFFYVYNVEKY